MSSPGRRRSFRAGVGVLAARGDASYYHFLTDVLPRLALLEERTAVQRLYLPASLPFQRQLIELLGIAPERVIDSDQVATRPGRDARGSRSAGR